MNVQSLPNMKPNSKTKPFPFALAFAAQTTARSFLRLTLVRTNQTSALSIRPPQGFFLQRDNSSGSAPLTDGLPSIYAVDDVPYLTELYVNLLASTGHLVRTFNNRPKALAALKIEDRVPALLITDYRGLSMPVNQFLQECRLLHPSLRILMASGFTESEMRLLHVKPDRFIQKPFSAQEFQQAVKAVLLSPG